VARLDLRLPLLTLLPASLWAQEPIVRTNVPLVIIPVSVTDTRGHFVSGLGLPDFVVLDNGVPQDIKLDDPDLITAPLDLVVLVQTSDISDAALKKIKKVGTMIQDAVAGANGSSAVITFADQIAVMQDFTTSDEALFAAFGKLRSAHARKGRLIDAVAEGLHMLDSRPKGGRSVLLIIGESKDRGSETQLEDLLPKIQRSGVTIYSLAYSAYLTAFTTQASEYTPPSGGHGWILDSITEAIHATKQDTCKVLTGATGGRQLKFETKSKLENDLIRLGGEIHSRYVLSFTPPEAAEPRFHKIAVEIRGRPELHVEARPGYWPDAEPIRK
jgi:VWFA-related protein